MAQQSLPEGIRILLEYRFGKGAQLLTDRRLAAEFGLGMAANEFPVPDISVPVGTVHGPISSLNTGRRPKPVRVKRTVTRPAPEPVETKSWGRRWAMPLVVATCAVVGGAVLLQPPKPAAARPVTAAAVGNGTTPSTLVVPVTPPAPVAPGEPAPTPKPTPKPEPKPAPKPAPKATQKVVLSKGDTLWALARRHHTTVRNLQNLNGLGTSTLIRAGATFKVPTTADRKPVTPAPKPTPKPQPQPKPTPKPTGKAGNTAVAYATAQVGKPYAWGATGPNAFDCSGLIMRAWQRAGMELPRTTWDMRRAGAPTTRKALVPGDLVITNGGAHVQLYIGDGKVVHAPGRGRTVTISQLPSAAQVVAYRHIFVPSELAR